MVMKNAMTCSFLVVCVVLVFGSKFASGEHGGSRKSSIQVTPIVTCNVNAAIVNSSNG